MTGGCLGIFGISEALWHIKTSILNMHSGLVGAGDVLRYFWASFDRSKNFILTDHYSTDSKTYFYRSNLLISPTLSTLGREKKLQKASLCICFVSNFMFFDISERWTNILGFLCAADEHLKSEASIINVADEKKKRNNDRIVIETRSKSDKRRMLNCKFRFFII